MPLRLAVLLLVCGTALAAQAALPPGRGILLPLQDRVGNPSLAEQTERLLQRELASRGELAVAEDLRATLRRLRIRDASGEAPERLGELAASVGGEWFFLATLHEAVRGREVQREAVGDQAALLEDAGATPQVTLSALLFQPDSPRLWWAGFAAASGRDHERWLGLGEIESLDELLQQAVADLVSGAAAERGPSRRIGGRRPASGFLRAPIRPATSSAVAVVPLDSVSNRRPSESAELVTAALFATLDEFGFATLLPGLVRRIRQDESSLQHGAVSRAEWEALAGRGGATWIATGTVETYEPGHGRNPDPWVAFSVRLLDAAQGRIGWIDGREAAGRETAAAFDRGRIYSAGDLAHEMMRLLFDRMRSSSGGGEAAGRE